MSAVASVPDRRRHGARRAPWRLLCGALLAAVTGCAGSGGGSAGGPRSETSSLVADPSLSADQRLERLALEEAGRPTVPTVVPVPPGVETATAWLALSRSSNRSWTTASRNWGEPLMGA